MFILTKEKWIEITTADREILCQDTPQVKDFRRLIGKKTKLSGSKPTIGMFTSLWRYLLFFPLSIDFSIDFVHKIPSRAPQSLKFLKWRPFIFLFLFCPWSPEGIEYESTHTEGQYISKSFIALCIYQTRYSSVVYIQTFSDQF